MWAGIFELLTTSTLLDWGSWHRFSVHSITLAPEKLFCPHTLLVIPVCSVCPVQDFCPVHTVGYVRLAIRLLRLVPYVGVSCWNYLLRLVELVVRFILHKTDYRYLSRGGKTYLLWLVGEGSGDRFGPPVLSFGLVPWRTTYFGPCWVCKSPATFWYFSVFFLVFQWFIWLDYSLFIFKLIIQIFISHFLRIFTWSTGCKSEIFLGIYGNLFWFLFGI